jgi:sensor histidine kinase regulating citrate/malate metabolism
MPNRVLINNTSQNLTELLEEEAKRKMPISSEDQILIDSIPYAICWKDINGKISGCNASFRNLFKIKNETNHRVFNEDEERQFDEIRKSVISRKSPEYFLIEMMIGEEKNTYEANESPIKNDDAIIGTVLTITKKNIISDAKKLEVTKGIASLREHIDKIRMKHA